MQTAQRRIPIGGDGGNMKHWSDLLPKYEQELANLKKTIAMLKAQAAGTYKMKAEDIKPLKDATQQTVAFQMENINEMCIRDSLQYIDALYIVRAYVIIASRQSVDNKQRTVIAIDRTLSLIHILYSEDVLMAVWISSPLKHVVCSSSVLCL